jgi:hypothetical protein
MVFRGRDKKDRMVMLLLNTPSNSDGMAVDESRKLITLELSYLLNPDGPDVFSNNKN